MTEPTNSSAPIDADVICHRDYVFADVKSIRREWLRLIGCDEDYIAESMETCGKLRVDSELLQLEAAIHLTSSDPQTQV